MPYQGSRGGYREGGRSRRDSDRDAEVDRNAEQFRKLFIGGLSYDTDEKGLKSHFEKYGEIADCVVMRDGQTKRSRGFGFITFRMAEGIDEAQKDRPHNIDGREIETKRAMPREEGGSQQTILKMFVGGLNDDTTDKDIRDLFEEFGEIDQIDMITDKITGKTRGFCFVTFKDYDPVDKCVLIKRHKLNGRNVEVKKAISRQDIGGGGGGRGRGRGSSRGGGDRRDSYGRGGGSRSYGDGGYGRDRERGSYGGRSSEGSWGGSKSLGQSYDSGYGGGAVRGGAYSSRSSGPYGSGYGSSDGYSSGYGGSSSYGTSSGDYSSSYSNADYGSGGGYSSGYSRR